MSIRFAAARGALGPRMAPLRVRALRLVATNDNGPPWQRVKELDAALRHFARHGLAAARVAADRAQAAQAAGDAAGQARWLDICRTLDHRMARPLECGAPTRQARTPA